MWPTTDVAATQRQELTQPGKAPRIAAAQQLPANPRPQSTGPNELSEEALDSVEKGQRAAIEAVRKFIDTVDQADDGARLMPAGFGQVGGAGA